MAAPWHKAWQHSQRELPYLLRQQALPLRNCGGRLRKHTMDAHVLLYSQLPNGYDLVATRSRRAYIDLECWKYFSYWMKSAWQKYLIWDIFYDLAQCVFLKNSLNSDVLYRFAYNSIRYYFCLILFTTSYVRPLTRSCIGNLIYCRLVVTTKF